MGMGIGVDKPSYTLSDAGLPSSRGGIVYCNRKEQRVSVVPTSPHLFRMTHVWGV